ncbi:MAG: polysaccharide deacetylase family protein [Alphaproteobacteria bacterium]
MAISLATSFLLVACTQTNLTGTYGAQTNPTGLVNLQPVTQTTNTQVQTAFGLMNLGQVINIDGNYYYAAANGLLPVVQDMAVSPQVSYPNFQSEMGSRRENTIRPKPRSTSANANASRNFRSFQKTKPKNKIIAKKSAKPNRSASASGEPQFVMLAFDGSRSLDMWRDTRSFARNHNIDFTYFVSGVYFLNEANKKKYKGPGYKAGVSHIGWASNGAEVGQRLEQLNAAVDEGHEIASHGNGHFNGSKWSQSQWRSEVRQFHSIMNNAYSNNGLPEPQGWRNKVKTRMFKGFRAPLLGVSSGMRPVLREFGYTYDTSKTANQSYWPKKIGGVYNFPLGHVKTAHSGVHTLSMDYNFYVAQSKGRPMPSKAKAFENEMYETYMSYFRNNYKGNRAPVHIGHHFSLWNKGAYWKAMKRFAREVCGKPDVRCTTYSELKQYMDYRQSNGAVASR